MKLRLIGLLCGVALGAGLPASAHEPAHHQHHAAPKPAPRSGAVELKLPDTRLRDQDSRDVRLKSDVLAGRVSVVNFVYTTCTTVCPVLSATMAQLQQRLGDRAGKQVRLVSITVDPQRDTPSRLKEYSAQHEAGSGWTWLTGRKSDVDAVLKAFGTFTPNPEDHPSVTMIGDAEGRRWTRLYGFPSVDEVLAQVEQALAVKVARHEH